MPWTARLVRGTSPGEPSTAKMATVWTLYGFSAASLAGGILFTLKGMDAGTQADEFARSQLDGFCADRGSPGCVDYLEQRRDESNQLLLGGALLGASAVFVLSAALTAELWSNRAPVQIAASAQPDGGMLGFSADF
jgi:hypothetical protein